ncbi:MAG: hypothetical protein ACLQVI_27475 [Polyangiaceae bacterium]
MSHRRIRRFAPSWVLVLVSLGAVALVGACKGAPKAGDPCTAGQGVCADPKSMMACIKGTFAPMPCHGAGGCVAKGKVADCDNSLSAVGDACDEIGDYACSNDMKSALSCVDNKFAVEGTCKGAGGCTLKKDGLYCDNDVSDQGDPCHTVGDFACTADKKLALKCGADHTMAPLNTCKGTKGCRVHEIPDAKKVEFICDDAVADANDPCDENGEEACTMDRKGLLKCQSNKFMPETACAGGCTFDPSGDKFSCDQGATADAASPGAPKKGAKKGK